MFHPASTRWLVGALLIAAPTSLAHAADAEAVANALGKALASEQGAQYTFASASEAGSDVTISGLTVTQPNNQGQFTFANTVVSGAEEAQGGGFTAETVTMTDGTLSGDGTGKIASATVEGVTILPEATVTERKLSSGFVYENATASGITFTPKDQQGEITVREASVRFGNVVDGEPQQSSGSVTDITVPASLVSNEQFQLSALGYDQLSFDVSWDAERTPETGDLDIRDATLSLENGGTLKLTGQAANVPVAAPGSDEMDTAALMNAAVKTVTLRYDDQSLAGRVLDYFAKQQGLERQQFAEQIAGALPLIVGAIGNPAFQEQLVGAVGTFLRDPKSLTITLAPPSPVPGSAIMQTVQTAPQTLPDQLGVRIEANAP